MRLCAVSDDGRIVFPKKNRHFIKIRVRASEKTKRIAAVLNVTFPAGGFFRIGF